MLKIKENKRQVKQGDIVSFKRKNHQIEGIVESIQENIVYVSVGDYARELLMISTNLTVINHKNYTIVTNILKPSS